MLRRFSLLIEWEREAAVNERVGLTRSAALDYAKENIRVNAVLPGNIETPMMDRFTGGDIQKAIDLEPVGRLGKPEEIAEAVLWMASDLGGFVTGAATVIDGGCRFDLSNARETTSW
jgi:NAD(P)-dependent dehydrogenase (short-subunit alcohol dehydrogenase family)